LTFSIEKMVWRWDQAGKFACFFLGQGTYNETPLPLSGQIHNRRRKNIFEDGSYW